MEPCLICISLVASVSHVPPGFPFCELTVAIDHFLWGLLTFSGRFFPIPSVSSACFACRFFYLWEFLEDFQC